MDFDLHPTYADLDNPRFWPILPRLASGLGCRGQRLSRGSGSPDKRPALWQDRRRERGFEPHLTRARASRNEDLNR
jgi:hypothetical protein